MKHMPKKFFFWGGIIVLAIILFLGLRLNHLLTALLMPDDSVTISFHESTAKIKYITNDITTSIPISVEALDAFKKPIKNLPISLKASDVITPHESLVYTNSLGQATFSFSLTDATVLLKKSCLPISLIFSNLKNTQIIKKELLLVPKPVLIVHGYQSEYSNLSNMLSFFRKKDLDVSLVKYDYTAGAANASTELSKKISSTLARLHKKGYYAKKVDLVSYSMGGLVTRLYTTSKEYNNDVSSITFISGANNGSYLASIGAYIYNNRSIEDLKPDSELVTRVLPNSLNEGLNPSIPVANGIGKDDEVISLENVSLEKWGIETTIFDIGDFSIDFDRLITDNVSASSIHNNILNNTYVFNWIFHNFNSSLPFPNALNKP